MFTKSIQTKTVIYIHDTSISYLSLAQNKQGFFVHAYEEAELDQDIIKRGEILKADFLIHILKKIGKTLENKTVDIILPHDYFFYEKVDSEELGVKTQKKWTQKFLDEKKKDEHSWVHSHHIETRYYPHKDAQTILFEGLPTEVYNSYQHVIQKSGLKLGTITSYIMSFDHLVKTERESLVSFEDEYVRVSEFKKGIYFSHRKFQSSYSQFIKDIQKNIDLSETEAQKILENYGVLRSHKDEKVYKRILKSCGPFLNFFNQRKLKDGEYSMTLVFQNFPIPGFVDLLSPLVKGSITVLDIMKQTSFAFHDILSLHKKESYHYQAHIAQALKSFVK